MADIQPIPRTHLTLDRYASIMGINPVHFQMAYSNTAYPILGSCDDVWYRYSWQRADRESHMSVAVAIKAAEEELANYVGYPLAPSFVSEEEIKYPSFHRPEYVSTSGLNIRGYNKSVNARWMKMRSTGRRGTTALALATAVVYTDTDTDLFFETAQISITITPAQHAALGDSREIKVFFEGTLANPDWEVRHPNRVEFTYNAGPDDWTVDIYMDSWLLIDPDLHAIPTMSGISGGTNAIDLSNSFAEFVATVDIYQEYVDKTVPSAIFLWETLSGHGTANLPLGSSSSCLSCSGAGCAICTRTQVSGCSHIRGKEASIIVPIPGTYSATTGLWSVANFLNCREPDAVSIYYYAGDTSDEYRNGYSTDPLSQFWADTIAGLATARLGREFCGCQGSREKAKYYQTDKARSGETFAYTIDFALTKNPFGTKVGELLAYSRATSFNVRKLDAALV